MAKVRLAKPGMQTFSSYMGVTQFKDGVSVDHVSQREIRLLGALTSIEVIEDDGETHQGGSAAEFVQARKTMRAPILTASKRGVDAPFREEETPAPQEHKAPAPDPDESDSLEDELERAIADAESEGAPSPVESAPAEQPKPLYTETDLAEIAEKRGIKGLREVADPMGVKDSSIAGLIKEILHRQKNPREVR